MTRQTVLYHVEDRVAIIRFNRPHALNRITVDLLTALAEALEQAEADPQVGAIVMTGEEGVFCAGIDYAAVFVDPVGDRDSSLDLGQLLRNHFNPIVLKLRHLGKPIVAAVNGIAAGAGASFALLADRTVAARSAYFQQDSVNLGLVPDAGSTWIMPQAVGLHRAMGLALLGEELSASRAHEWGIVSEVVDDEKLISLAVTQARSLASGPAGALARIIDSPQLQRCAPR